MIQVCAADDLDDSAEERDDPLDSEDVGDDSVHHVD